MINHFRYCLILFLQVLRCQEEQKFEINGFNLAWKDLGDSIKFTYRTIALTNDDVWMGLGFSKDNQMGNDDMVICKSFNNTKTVDRHFSLGKFRPPLLNPEKPQLGLLDTSVFMYGPEMTCEFTRLKSMDTVPNYYDSSENHHLLFAKGLTDRKGNESETILGSLFGSNPGSEVDPCEEQDISEEESVKKLTENCGTEYGCFVNPANCTYSDCISVVKWKDMGQYVNFYVAVNSTEISAFTRYIGVGFSKDFFMGDDSVSLCRFSIFSRDYVVESYFNVKKAEPDVINSNIRTLGNFNYSLTINQTYLICEFNRIKYLNESRFFNLHFPYHILLSFGRTNALGSPTFHGLNAFSSKEKINFEKKTITSPYQTSMVEQTVIKEKTHACLMVIAWIFFASTGMVFARYMKFLLPEKTLCGKKIWFVVHSPFMIMVAVISLTSFLVILSAKGWKWIPLIKPVNYAHSIFGIVAISFSIFQVFLGIMRPNRNHPRRYLFNFVHKTLGYSSLIFSVVAMFLGVNIEKMKLGRVGWGLMVGWTLWCFIFPLITEILKLYYDDKKRPYKFEEKQDTSDDADSEQYQDQNQTKKNMKVYFNYYEKIFNGIKTVFAVFHVIVAFAFTLALVVCIGIADGTQNF
ncbi:ferric-chelate reductase 1 isoform X1 [Brachionus plicatilis]|uniref:Ferric-chelate reductase 1 isoform X1 n=1 Tax=Brachionus plicatilis TaxID=10195 RepID=A0A3M7PV12_BRAPC|nr:ferric-chelate reductase 1 isoform X1 [Brachionus plicatilis]